MKKTVLTSFVLLISYIISLNPVWAKPNPDLCKMKDRQKITAVIASHLNNPNNSVVSANKWHIFPTYCVQNFALVKIHPNKPVTDDGYAYLQKKAGAWYILTWEPITPDEKEYLDIIPKQLRNYYIKETHR